MIEHIQTCIGVREPLWVLIERGEVVIGGGPGFIVTVSRKEGKMFRYADDVGGSWRRKLELVFPRRYQFEAWTLSKLIEASQKLYSAF